jgi:putative ABC transport system permease protein
MRGVGARAASSARPCASTLFGDEDPLGRTIRVGKLPVHGRRPCSRPSGQTGFGQDYDDTVLMPITTLRAGIVAAAQRAGEPSW